jgi:thiol-disulfide isomerase/thioredoxin
MLVLLIAIFSYLGYSTYKQSVEGFDIEKKKFQNVANAQEFAPTVDIYLFFADWCPHCKTAKPEWDKIKRKYNGKEVHGYLVNCIDVNCTDDAGETTTAKHEKKLETKNNTAEIIHKFGVNSYPTIKLVKDEKPYDFEAKVTEPNLSGFIEEILSE